MDVLQKLKSLRELMAKNGIAAYIIPSPDPHQSEYVAEHFKSRAWFSGFAGSAGTVVVTQNDAGLWTDGRYWIQAEKQLHGSSIRLFKMLLPGIPNLQEWIAEQLNEGDTIGFDGRLFSVNDIRKIAKLTEKKKIKLNYNVDFVSDIWTENRPSMPKDVIYDHDIRFAGKSRTEKINEVRQTLKKKSAKAHLLSSVDDIAWLFNFRGNDVNFLPVAYSYAYIDENNAHLFIASNKVQGEMADAFKKDNIIVHEYADIFNFLKEIKLSGKILINPDRISVKLTDCLDKSIEFVEDLDVSTTMKCIKNSTEIKCINNSQKKDGVALVKFIKYIKEAVKTEDLDEYDITPLLIKFRKEQEYCLGASFDTIAGYEENAALMHYKANKANAKKLAPKNMLLIDSGGNYLDGTTDITRTLILGEISDEMKRDFTLVLKSHINLARAIFLYGTNGVTLDGYARKPLWDTGNDYKCGTGHGVGFCLSVHEGPQGFAMRDKPYVFEEGMIITNEPGIYKEGRHGVRHENTMLVKEAFTNENGRFLCFETISYCPIDLKGIDFSLLSQEETNWLREYHQKVYEVLSPALNDEEKAWLKQNTEF